METSSARIVPYPEPYGPAPKAFRRTTNVLIHKSIFVEFRQGTGTKTFQFEGGLTDYNALFLDPTSGNHIVIAQGEGYEFDSNKEIVISDFGCAIRGNLILGGNQLILWSDTEIASFGILRWQSKRLSLDGIEIEGRDGNSLLCAAWDPMDDKWHKFTLNLTDGKVISGYDCPFT